MCSVNYISKKLLYTKGVVREQRPGKFNLRSRWVCKGLWTVQLETGQLDCGGLCRPGGTLEEKCVLLAKAMRTVQRSWINRVKHSRQGASQSSYIDTGSESPRCGCIMLGFPILFRRKTVFMFPKDSLGNAGLQ